MSAEFIDAATRGSELEFDATGATPGAMYRLLTSLVVPRPIAWISTRSAEGVDNLAPHSWFTQASVDPPCIVFSSVGEKDTLRNIRATKAFVVNVVDERVLEPMNLTAADAPADVDEFRLAGVTPAPARQVEVARVLEAPAHLECTCEQLIEVGDATLIVGRVVHVHVAAAVRGPDGADAALLRPVARLSGSAYALFGDVVSTPRPSWQDVLDARGASEG
jgi:flavin reductase (DIM6/NTAB) family NADH-FMN oxidoreductase RutF